MDGQKCSNAVTDVDILYSTVAVSGVVYVVVGSEDDITAAASERCFTADQLTTAAFRARRDDRHRAQKGDYRQGTAAEKHLTRPHRCMYVNTHTEM